MSPGLDSFQLTRMVEMWYNVVRYKMSPGLDTFQLTRTVEIWYNVREKARGEEMTSEGRQKGQTARDAAYGRLAARLAAARAEFVDRLTRGDE